MSRRGPPSDHSKCGRRVDDALRAKMYQDWKNGIRGINTLATKYGLAFVTARRIVKQGNPNRHWPPFEVALALEGQTLKTAETMASEKIAEVLVDEWEKAKREDLMLVQGNKAMLGRLIKRFMDETKDIEFAHTGYDKNGEAYKTPMTGSEAANVARNLAQAAATLVQVESLLMGKPTERAAITQEDKWEKLTPEQCKYILETGKLPPGVEETLFGPPTKTPSN